MFLKKWTNETIASKILLPHIILTHPIEIYFHIIQEKNLAPQNFVKFQVKSLNYDGGGQKPWTTKG